MVTRCPGQGAFRAQPPRAPTGEHVCGGQAPGSRVPAVVGSVGLDAAALGALVHHLSRLQL